MKTMMKAAVAAVAMVAGAHHAQAMEFVGTVLDQPRFEAETDTPGFGRISFDNARIAGTYTLPGNFSRPIEGILDVYANFRANASFSANDLQNPTFIVEGQNRFIATSYVANVALTNGVYNGSVKYLGYLSSQENYGSLLLNFNGNVSSGFDTDFLLQIPEPSTWALMIVGFGLVGGANRKRKPAVVSFA